MFSLLQSEICNSLPKKTNNYCKQSYPPYEATHNGYLCYFVIFNLNINTFVINLYFSIPDWSRHLNTVIIRPCELGCRTSIWITLDTVLCNMALS